MNNVSFGQASRAPEFFAMYVSSSVFPSFRFLLLQQAASQAETTARHSALSHHVQMGKWEEGEEDGMPACVDMSVSVLCVLHITAGVTLPFSYEVNGVAAFFRCF